MTTARRLALFLAWWRSELRACLPRFLRRSGAGHSRALLVVAGRGPLQFSCETPEGRRALAVPATASRQAVASALRGAGPWSEIIVLIARENALYRHLSLPLAVAENLWESVGFEIDRLAPFRPEDVIYQTTVEEIDRPRDRLTCALTIVQRSVADRALADLAALGVRADRLCVEPPAGAASAPVVLPLPLAGRLERWLGWRLPVALSAIAAVLAVVAWLSLLDGRAARLDAYLAQMSKYRPAAAAAATVRAEVGTLAALRATAAQQRSSRPLLVNVLAELTRQLPDDTWLTDLKIAGGHLSLSGLARSAASLVPVIEGSPLFQNARLSGPVTVDPRLERERFTIEADLTPPKGGS